MFNFIKELNAKKAIAVSVILLVLVYGGLGIRHHIRANTQWVVETKNDLKETHLGFFTEHTYQLQLSKGNAYKVMEVDKDTFKSLEEGSLINGNGKRIPTLIDIQNGK